MVADIQKRGWKQFNDLFDLCIYDLNHLIDLFYAEESRWTQYFLFNVEMDFILRKKNYDSYSIRDSIVEFFALHVNRVKQTI